MSIKINGNDVIDNNRKGLFQSANVGSFSNPQRPGSASTGDLIWSTTDNQLQVWNGSSWVKATGDGATISASGGSEFTPGNGYKVHVFTSPGTFTLSSPTAQIEHAIVAGGGGSGASIGVPGPFGYSAQGAAGGGGGVLVTTATLSAGSYTITVGGGGAGGSGGSSFTPGAKGSNGSNSSISGPSGTWTATGGGGGASFRQDPTGPNSYVGNPGGSGGGSAGSTGPAISIAGASGTPGQGFPAGGFQQGFPIPHPGIGPISGGGGGADQPGGPPIAGARNFGRGLGLDWGIPGSYGTSSDPLANNVPYQVALSYNSPARHLGRYFGGGGYGTGIPTPYFSIGYTPGGGGLTGNGLGNTGGGAGRSTPPGPTAPANGNSGGSGIVIIRYRTVQ